MRIVLVAVRDVAGRRRQCRLDLGADIRVGLGLAASLQRRARAAAAQLPEGPCRVCAHQRFDFIAE
jgi:hypothetical protein